MSPDSITTSLYREVVKKTPHEFKIGCLSTVKDLFPPEWNPFYAGFGNRVSDEKSYATVGVPDGKIFTINPSSEVACVGLGKYSKTYTLSNINSLLDHMFPPVAQVSLRHSNKPFPFVQWLEEHICFESYIHKLGNYALCWFSSQVSNMGYALLVPGALLYQFAFLQTERIDCFCERIVQTYQDMPRSVVTCSRSRSQLLTVERFCLFSDCFHMFPVTKAVQFFCCFTGPRAKGPRRIQFVELLENCSNV